VGRVYDNRITAEFYGTADQGIACAQPDCKERPALIWATCEPRLYGPLFPPMESVRTENTW
jgi:hypothetical protein